MRFSLSLNFSYFNFIMVGSLSALEWLIYDSFKVMAGLETTGEK